MRGQKRQAGENGRNANDRDCPKPKNLCIAITHRPGHFFRKPSPAKHHQPHGLPIRPPPAQLFAIDPRDLRIERPDAGDGFTAFRTAIASQRFQVVAAMLAEDVVRDGIVRRCGGC